MTQKIIDSCHLPSGQIVYDPRGRVDVAPKSLAPRPATLAGLRLGVLDNSKWNAGRLLRKIISLLENDYSWSAVHFYKKESFSRNASPELIAQIAAENDLVITAIGD